MGAKDSFTIDELAAAAGMTPRNVRAYRTKGLLFPPVRVGRTSQYRTAHLHRLRDIRQLREAGLPLKMIIEAAHRGEDLGPTGALWQAAAGNSAPLKDDGSNGATFIEDPQAYAIMQALTGRGVAPATVLLLALRAARSAANLGNELNSLLSEIAPPADPTPPANGHVIDLATVIAREMLTQTLPPSP